MPSDEYNSFRGGGGTLRLKGAKVKKHKKKRDKGSGLERALSTGGSSSRPASDGLQEGSPGGESGSGREVERRGNSRDVERPGGDRAEGDDEAPVAYKTEAERRFAEARRKKLLEMSESASARPELLKTHKQRVEELNTYLSRLSEHHDMPKIGPG